MKVENAVEGRASGGVRVEGDQAATAGLQCGRSRFVCTRVICCGKSWVPTESRAMPEFRFDPPLTLKGNIVVRNLDDAVRFMTGYREARRPALQTKGSRGGIRGAPCRRRISRLGRGSMGGDSLSLKPLCPACGRPMGLTRTVPVSPGYSELRTYGCKECGVWVTEGSSVRDQRRDTFVVPK